MHAGVPAHLIDGLVLYLTHGIQPGSFLLAVLTNDLFAAMNRADEESREGLYRLCVFIWNDVPASAWGTKAKVSDWMTARREEQSA